MTTKKCFCCPSRKAFFLYVDLDPTPGTFNTPRSAYENVQTILNDVIFHYLPVTALVDVKYDTGHRPRACFVIFVNLDVAPGSFHTQESAEVILSATFNNRIPHYNPIVSLAPEAIQPDNITEGKINA